MLDVGEDAAVQLFNAGASANNNLPAGLAATFHPKAHTNNWSLIGGLSSAHASLGGEAVLSGNAVFDPQVLAMAGTIYAGQQVFRSGAAATAIASGTGTFGTLEAAGAAALSAGAVIAEGAAIAALPIVSAISEISYNNSAQAGSYLPASIGHSVLNGNHLGLFANPLDQIEFDQANRANNNTVSVLNTNLLPSAIASDEGKFPQAFITPIPDFKPISFITPLPEERKPLILATPVAEEIMPFGQLPGFAPEPFVKPLLESFPIHERDWKDLILLKDYELETPQSRKCEKGESGIWQELENYKVINGKQTKTNGLSGKKGRYYQWDDWHKEIEVYDSKGRPLEVIDPVKGEIIPKSVRKHRKIET